MPRSYYAARYPYGIAIWADSGRLIRTVYRFDSPEEREAWVRDGGDYRTQPNYREPVRAREVSAHERRHLREADGSPATFSTPVGVSA